MFLQEKRTVMKHSTEILSQNIINVRQCNEISKTFQQLKYVNINEQLQYYEIKNSLNRL